MNYYESFTGKLIPKSYYEYVKNQGWIIKSTDKIPPACIPNHEVVFSLNINDWYLKPIVSKNGYKYHTCNGLVVKPDPVAVGDDFFVMDNFYHNPLAVRKQALLADRGHLVEWFHSELSDSYSNQSIEDYFRFLFGDVHISKERANGNFKYNTKHDGRLLNRIHADSGAEWAVIIYLNDEEDYQYLDGTCLYKHNKSGLLKHSEDWDVLEKSEYFADGHYSNLWDKYFTCPIKFNRAFFYNARLFHKEATWFDNRIVHRFFISKKIA